MSTTLCVFKGGIIFFVFEIRLCPFETEHSNFRKEIIIFNCQ